MPKVKLYANLRKLAGIKEASYLLKKVPIVMEQFASGMPQMANKVTDAFKNYKIIMLRGHGRYTTGQTLDEAFFWSSTLEEACRSIRSGESKDEKNREIYRRSRGIRWSL